MISPCKQYIVGMRYGAPVWYYPFRHPGIDLLPLSQSLNPELYVPGNGVVSYMGYSLSAGNMIDINLDNGKAVRLCHMKYRALANVGQRVSEGELIGIMGATGTLIIPRGYKHLHYVMFTDHSKKRTMDPAPYLVNNPTKIDVPALFTQIWKRLPATGEKLYFENRLKSGDIKDREDLIDKMTYWYQTVYPNEKLSIAGDAKWQRAKNS